MKKNMIFHTCVCFYIVFFDRRANLGRATRFPDPRGVSRLPCLRFSCKTRRYAYPGCLHKHGASRWPSLHPPHALSNGTPEVKNHSLPSNVQWQRALRKAAADRSLTSGSIEARGRAIDQLLRLREHSILASCL